MLKQDKKELSSHVQYLISKESHQNFLEFVEQKLNKSFEVEIFEIYLISIDHLLSQNKKLTEAKISFISKHMISFFDFFDENYLTESDWTDFEFSSNILEIQTIHDQIAEYLLRVGVDLFCDLIKTTLKNFYHIYLIDENFFKMIVIFDFCMFIESFDKLFY